MYIGYRYYPIIIGNNTNSRIKIYMFSSREVYTFQCKVRLGNYDWILMIPKFCLDWTDYILSYSILGLLFYFRIKY